MNDFYYDAGKRIRNLRELNSYTREAFAEKANMSAKFLYEIETGQKGFSADTLYKIANALSVNCEYILTGELYENYSEKLLKTINHFNNAQLQELIGIMEAIYKLMEKHKASDYTCTINN